MKNKLLYSIFGILLVVSSFLQFSYQQTSAKDKVRWEYLTRLGSAGEPSTNSLLNELGEQEWELVTIQTEGNTHHYIFKRKKR